MDPNQYNNGGQPNYYQQPQGGYYQQPQQQQPAAQPNYYQPSAYGTQPSGGVYVGNNAFQGTSNMYQQPAPVAQPVVQQQPVAVTPAAAPASSPKPPGPQPGGSTSYNPYFYKVVLLGEGGVGA
jgi:hypothetical protein